MLHDFSYFTMCKTPRVRILKRISWGEDSRWRFENNPGLELSLNPQPGESELHFQTDLCCPQNGETPKYKRDMGCQAAGAAAAGPSQQSPQGALVRVPC